MKKSVLAICILVVALLVMFFMQRQKETALHQQNDSLRQQLEQLQSNNDRLSNSLAEAQSVPPPADSSLELARLRNQVGMLRQKTNELGKMRVQNHQVQIQAVAQPETISPEDRFVLDRTYATDAVKQLGLAMHVFASDNNDHFATNFDQLKAALGGNTNFAGGLTLDSFEFVNSGIATPQTPDLFIFWEKVARKTPDGKWIRIYGFADGSVQIHGSADGNFDDYEKAHLAPPPTQ